MFQRIGAPAFKKDLTNTVALCEMLGNPQRKFKSIHVAGTNGKGSVSHLLAAMLQSQGYKTGLYVSPHYKDFRERIKINGEYIPEENVIRFVERYQHDYEKIKPSFFEITVAMAFDHFTNEKVDIAVIETGMGGRFDSTNVITPLLSVITNIGFDHMQFLGSTLPAIAFEKAGIIKPNIPVVIGETDYETAPVFLQAAEERHSPIEFADQHVRMVLKEKKFEGMIFDVVEHEQVKHKDLKTELFGDFQLKNLATVWLSAWELNKAGFELSEQSMINGIQNVKNLTNMKGRWDFLSTSGPIVICDSGHNSHGMKETMRELKALPHNKLHLVIGFVKDKDLNAVLSLFPTDARYYFCRPDIPRGLDENELKQKALEFGLNGETYPSVSTALENAKATAEKNDIVFIGGSTFVVAEVV